MKRTYLCFLFALVITRLCLGQNEYVSQVLEYKPAPGQFVNTSGWGTPARANSLIGGINGGISLGGFGGYIVVAFDHAVENDPSNPYGVDFTVFGNPLADPLTKAVTWSEPGAVMVMKDVNGNGLPDDTWYELAGSDYYFKSSIRNYALTYANPQQPTAADVPWTDNLGQRGKVLANQFHLQPYYPLPANFPGINNHEITFQGTCIKAYVDRSNPSLIMSYQRGFGYVDNTIMGVKPYTVPDNPYTKATENSGGDAFDIGWAVDAKGNSVDLDVIHFIKIYNAVNADAGWLGEVSTEIRGVVDAAPNAAITGVLDQVVLADLPVTTGRNLEFALEAYAFRQGILQPDAGIDFSIDNPAVASITPANTLRTNTVGKVVVTAALRSNPAIRSQTTINIIEPVHVKLDLSTFLRINTRQGIAFEVVDKGNQPIANVPLDWHTSDASVADVIQENGRLYARGLGEGQAWLVAYGSTIPTLKDSVLLTVLPEGTNRQVYLTIKDERHTIYARRKISVSNFNLNPYVGGVPHKSYDINALSTITVAHAIASVFDNVGFESDVRFLDDNTGLQRLYLWRVPIKEEGGVSYASGLGGGSNSQTSEGWLVKINQHTYITGLDEVKINEDDEIVVYHLDNTRLPWQFINLTASADSVDTGVTVVINATRTAHALTADHLVTTENSESIQNETVHVNNKPLAVDGQPIVTDELGNASVQFAYSGLQRVMIAGSFIDIFVNGDLLVGTADESASPLHPWPNPVNQSIHVPLRDQNMRYEILDSKGSIRLEGVIGPDGTIDIDALTAGIYLLRVSGGRSITPYKFIKS